MGSLLPTSPDPDDDAEPRVIGLDSEDADDLMAALSAGTAREILGHLHESPATPADLAEAVDTSLQNVHYHLEKLEAADLVAVVDTVYSEKGQEMKVYGPADRPLVIFAGDEEEGGGVRAAIERLGTAVGILALGTLALQQLFGPAIGRLFRDAAAGGPVVDTPTPDAETATPDPDTPAATATDTGEATPTPAETATPTPAGTATDTPAATGTPAPTGTPTATEAPSPTPAPDTTTATEAPIATVTETATPVVTEAAGGELVLPPTVLFFLGGLTALGIVGLLWYLQRP